MDAHPPPDTRRIALNAWLERQARPLDLMLDSLTPLPGDASFRRYFRIQSRQRPLIVMDAADARDECAAFIRIDQQLAAAGLRVPEILAHDIPQGFLLLSDLGPRNYYECLQSGQWGASEQQQHYRAALRVLVRLQQCAPQGLATYDQACVREELELFPQWFLRVHLGQPTDAQTQDTLAPLFTLLAQRADAEPHVLIHRDFHSPNLIPSPEHEDDDPGLIDFQDALVGPITYDIASLVMDARTTWDESQQLDWAIRYWEYARAAGLPVDPDIARFHAAYEWMGLQRNLRILGVFARLAHRDGKPRYLDHVPRVLAYVRQVAARYRVFTPLLRLLDRTEGAPRRLDLAS